MAVIFLSAMLLPLLNQSSGASQTIGVTFNIPGEPEQAEFIRGFWHNFSVPSMSDAITIKMTRSTSPQNETNHYAWSYKNGAWSDEMYQNIYINASGCIRANSFTVFRLGMDVTAVAGPWQLEITAGGNVIHSGSVNVISPVRDISLFAPDSFIIAEINTTDWIKPVSDQHFRLRNRGNVPLRISKISFFEDTNISRNANFKLTNSSQSLPVGGDSTHFLSFRLDDSMPAPSYLSIKCRIEAKAQQIIPTSSSHVIESILAHQFDIKVYVKHVGDYFVDASSNLIYEYKTTMDMVPDKKIQHELFITAMRDTTMTFAITSAKVEITQIKYSGAVRSAPFNITLNASKTGHIILDVMAYEENATGKFIYGITPAGGRTEHLQVDVNIGYKQPPIERIWVIVSAIAFIALLIVLGAISALLKKKRRLKELNEKKRKKEGMNWKRRNS